VCVCICVGNKVLPFPLPGFGALSSVGGAIGGD
jgi:hypothetical protein